jgi:orotate phosphoribosyltransferase
MICKRKQYIIENPFSLRKVYPVKLHLAPTEVTLLLVSNDEIGHRYNARVNTANLAIEIYKVCRLEGKFLLRSGAISREYFDKYLFESRPKLLKRIANDLLPLIPPETDVLAGLELGGVPLAVVLSQLTNLPTTFVRKEAKTYGTKKLAEGIEVSGAKVLLVEDVVTSGGQLILSSSDLRSIGAKVTNALCVIDREAGGVENLASKGVNLESLFTLGMLQQLSSQG